MIKPGDQVVTMGCPNWMRGHQMWGALIGWRSMTQMLMEFTQRRTKEKFIEYTARKQLQASRGETL